jgi:hypothetical protein
MPWVFAALRIFLVVNVTGFVLRVLVALGINIILLQPAINTITGLLTGQFGGLPVVVAGWLGFLNIDKYVSLILSAYAIQQTANFVLRVNR